MDLMNGRPASPSQSPDEVHRTNTSSATAANNTPHGSVPSLNPRSCVTCRRRKVKCNKQYPCSNCLKAHIDCIFPAPGRAPRRPRKPPDGELLARLRRLEGVVQSLGVQVDDDPRLSSDLLGDVHVRDLSGHEQSNLRPDQKPLPPPMQTFEQRRDSLTTDFGRLVMNEGKSRYVNNRFWAAVSNEVEDLKGILDESSEEEADCPSPVAESQVTPSHHTFIFSIPSNANGMHSLHPSPGLIRQYWQLFVEHCDPLMKMLHIPSMQEQVHAAMIHPGKASKAIEVLLFAVYFASVTSLTPEECQAMTGESKDVLAERYRHGVEQALVRAHFLFTEEIVVLQGFIIFLVCLRRYEDPRVIWSLCGLACRMAITMGLHRDGSNFDIPPFDIEIRRRTWWQILILDIRSSEEHGCDPVIVHHEFDTKFPLNIEDEDIYASMPDPPAERDGITKTSFCLIRYNSARNFARLFARPAPFLSPTGSWPEPTLQEKERWVREVHEHLEDKYFRHCNMQNPMHWVICTVSKLILAKQYLCLYLPFQRLNQGSTLSPAIKERLFVTSIESIENALRLEIERKTVKWGWLFKSYSQFHALAYLLTELTRRTRGPLVERAWRAVDDTRVEFWERDPENKRGPMWNPIMKLEETARAARERDLALDKQESAPASVKYEEESTETEHLADPNESAISNSGQMSDVKSFAANNKRRAVSTTNNTMFDNTTSFSPRPTIGANNKMHGSFLQNTMGAGMSRQANFPTTAPQASQWHGLSASGTNNVPMGDWFADPHFGAMPNIDTASFGPDGEAQQQHRFTAGDPMVSGSEGPGMQWAEWEEMMREFELESGQSGGGTNQWQRRPVMGESWL